MAWSWLNYSLLECHHILFLEYFFLLAILGFESPFYYLPDNGIKYFLNSQAVTQAVGLFLEAIFMSLVLAKKNKVFAG